MENIYQVDLQKIQKNIKQSKILFKENFKEGFEIEKSNFEDFINWYKKRKN